MIHAWHSKEGIGWALLVPRAQEVFLKSVELTLASSGSGSVQEASTYQASTLNPPCARSHLSNVENYELILFPFHKERICSSEKLRVCLGSYTESCDDGKRQAFILIPADAKALSTLASFSQPTWLRRWQRFSVSQTWVYKWGITQRSCSNENPGCSCGSVVQHLLYVRLWVQSVSTTKNNESLNACLKLMLSKVSCICVIQDSK